MISFFDQSDYYTICNKLAAQDADLFAIIQNYGFPPLWSRPNTFETLVHIILEQQVSLASALSALNKLKDKVQELTPSGILLLTDEQMKACYCSRQKTSYIRHLAETIVSGKLNLIELEKLEDEDVRTRLVALKGIGNWTADVYLMFVLHRSDIFPVGDLAAINALKKVKKLPFDVSREEMILITKNWYPYRTIAAMLLWHYYLSVRWPKKSKSN